MKIKYHTDCKTLPIYNFYKIIDNSDFLFLVKGYSEYDDDVIEGYKENEAFLIFQKILEEYSLLTSNKEVLVGLNMQIHISEMTYERNLYKNVMSVFHETKDFSIVYLLSDLGFSIKPTENAEDLLKRLLSHIKRLNNKIRIKKINYSNRFKKNKEQIKSDLEKEAIMLELNLELGREIDTHKTSVSKWVKMINISKERSREYDKISKR